MNACSETRSPYPDCKPKVNENRYHKQIAIKANSTINKGFYGVWAESDCLMREVSRDAINPLFLFGVCVSCQLANGLR